MTITLQEAAALASAPRPRPNPAVVASRDRLRAICLKRAQAFFGADLPLAEVTEQRIDQWIEALIADEYSPLAIDRYLWTLQSMLTRAVDSGLLATLPRVKESQALKAYRLAQDQELRDRIAKRRAAIRAAHPSISKEEYDRLMREACETDRKARRAKRSQQSA